jgi:hypothetical protein
MPLLLEHTKVGGVYLHNNLDGGRLFNANSRITDERKWGANALNVIKQTKSPCSFIFSWSYVVSMSSEEICAVKTQRNNQNMWYLL